MAGKIPQESQYTGPESPMKEFDKANERVAREVAGELPYASDDPERPFTIEYDTLETDAVTDVKLRSSVADALVDKTPSADARALYVVPTTQELGQNRVNRNLRAVRASLRSIKDREVDRMRGDDSEPATPKLALGGLAKARAEAKARRLSGDSVE